MTKCATTYDITVSSTSFSPSAIMLTHGDVTKFTNIDSVRRRARCQSPNPSCGLDCDMDPTASPPVTTCSYTWEPINDPIGVYVVDEARDNVFNMTVQVVPPTPAPTAAPTPAPTAAPTHAPTAPPVIENGAVAEDFTLTVPQTIDGNLIVAGNSTLNLATGVTLLIQGSVILDGKLVLLGSSAVLDVEGNLDISGSLNVTKTESTRVGGTLTLLGVLDVVASGNSTVSPYVVVTGTQVFGPLARVNLRITSIVLPPPETSENIAVLVARFGDAQGTPTLGTVQMQQSDSECLQPTSQLIGAATSLTVSVTVTNTCRSASSGLPQSTIIAIVVSIVGACIVAAVVGVLIVKYQRQQARAKISKRLTQNAGVFQMQDKEL